MLRSKHLIWVACLLIFKFVFSLQLNGQNCTLVCNGNLNISLDPSGQITVTPSMLHAGTITCTEPLSVSLMHMDGSPIPGTILDCQFVGQSVKGMLADGNGNSCWTNLTIEDKSAPEIICNDVTINCTASSNPDENTLLVYPQFLDNCTTADWSFSDNETELNCADGFSSVIARTWTVSDAMGNTATCVQQIFIDQPLLSAVTLPAHVMDVPCNGDIGPDVIPGPELFGIPLYQNMVCNFMAIYNDQSISLCGQTEKILRNWRILDMCQNTDTVFLQFIKTVDLIPPVITCPDSLVIPTNFNDCFATFTHPLLPAVSEECGNYTLEISSAFGTGPGPFDLPPGDHIFTFTATDECGNSSSCNNIVTVIDDFAPIAICDDIVVALDANGNGRLCAVDFDNGSSDNCAIDTLLIRRMDSCLADSSGTNFSDCIPLRCCDVGTEVMVLLGVLDTAGNYNECMNAVLVQDKIAPEILCPPDLTFECDQYPLADSLIGNILITEPGDPFPPLNPDGLNGYAYDNCFIDTIRVSTLENIDQCQQGTITRTFIVTDHTGLTSSCIQFITFEDTMPPELSFPPNITVDCTNAHNTDITGEATATDNCALFAINYEDVLVLPSPDDACTDKIFREWRILDYCTDSLTTYTQWIFSVDSTPPTFNNSLPDTTITNLCFGDPLPSEPIGGVSDNCSIPTIELLDDVSVAGNCLNNFTITRTWRATDACGQSTTLIQNILVMDIHPPVFSNVPADTLIECGLAMPPANIIASDNCDNNLIATLNETNIQGACPGSFTTIRTWTATDNCGNVGVTSQTIIHEDRTPPAFLNFPADLSFECDENIAFPAMPGTIDNCDNDVEVTITEQTQNATNCLQEYSILRTYTATDDCGNATTQTLTISIVDSNAPTLTSVPTDITLECDETIPNIPLNITASDNCDSTPNIIFTETSLDGDCPFRFELTRRWSTTDACGNNNFAEQKITVDDSMPPVFSPEQRDMTIECDQPIPEANVTALDNCSGQISNINFTEITTPGSCPSNYNIVRTWRATDLCGNTAEMRQVIHVVDSMAPDITNVPPDATFSCDEAINLPAPTFNENCDTNTSILVLEIITEGNCADNYTIQRTWTYIDNCENISSASAVFTLQDITPPEITGPVDVIVECDNIPSVEPDANFITSDNCTPSVFINYDGETVTDSICPNSYTLVRIWTATDECGNSNTTSQTIVVQDTTPPVLNVQPDTLIAECSSLPSLQEQVLSFTDNCGEVLVSSIIIASQLGCRQNIIQNRFWSATDECGNVSTAVQVVIIEDNNPPDFPDIEDDITIACTDTIPVPVITDSCSMELTLEFNDTRINEDCPYTYTLNRSWIATDECGNSSTKTQTVRVEDTEAPTMVPQADITVTCNNIPLPVTPIVNDNCSIVDSINTDIVEIEITGNCTGNYQLLRNFRATDECGNSSFVTRLVSVIDTVPPVMTNFATDTLISCELFVNYPLPDVMDNCDMAPTISFEDFRTGGQCMQVDTVLRVWTAIDDCGNSSTASATIKLFDNIPPVITCSPDIDTQNLQLNGCIIFLPVMATATDNCDESPDFSAHIVNIDPVQGNDLDTIILSGDLSSFPFLFGTTTVTFTATDNCGNSDSCAITIFTRDVTDPGVSCGGFPVVLNSTDPINLGDYIRFNSMLSGDCSPVVEVITIPEQVTCDDLYMGGPGLQISVVAIDLWGNVTPCNPHIFVVDGGSFCSTVPLSENPTHLFGTIKTTMNQSLESVNVYIEEDMNDMYMSNQSGSYLFHQLEMGNDYSVRPYKNDDASNGVTTYDLVALNRHIIGLQPLDSPYKLIAADINNSGSITTYDAVLLKRIILNIDNAFTENTSWRFVHKNYNFPDNGNPFAENFPEEYIFQNIEHYVHDADFTAIKIGDLNNSATGASFARPNYRKGEQFSIMVKDQQIEAGETVTIPVMAKAQSELAALQFTIGFDPEKLRLATAGQTDVELYSTMEETNFGFNKIASGLLNFAWAPPNAQQFTSGQVLFELKFIAEEAIPSLQSLLSLHEKSMAAVAYNINGESMSVQLDFEANNSVMANEVIMLQNKPNPFNKSTVISFHLPEAGPVTLLIYDMNGQTIHTLEIAATKGLNEIEIQADIFPADGVYHSRVITPHGMAAGKLLKTR